MRYPVEKLTTAEAARLAPHVTSLDSPVYALTNLPETVKAAMFARFSRYQGTLRRLFLEEFAETLPTLPAGVDANEGARAAGIMERVFVGYGDDSVAQLGGAHLSAEWVSNVLTKVLQRPRIHAAYLEQSTRYIAFDTPIDEAGRMRYWRADGQVQAPALASPAYVAAMDELFAIYTDLLGRMRAWSAERFPRGEDEPQAAWERAIGAKALDAVRGVLPASTMSHMGVYASGQTYESLVMHLLAHPLPEARAYGQMMLEALQQVIPSFLARVERPDRGGRWVDHLAARRRTGEYWADRLDLRRDVTQDRRSSVRLVEVRGSERDLVVSLLAEEVGVSEQQVADALRAQQVTRGDLPGDVPGLGAYQEVLTSLVGERENRRHRPGRGLERLSYRFEVVSDYGAFRDLQRHRPLTAQWQTLTPDLGFETPPEIEEAGLADRFAEAMAVGARAYETLLTEADAHQAAYALPLAYRIRYTLDMNAREAMHLTELRSGAAGHPAYRAVAIEMHRLISEQHPTVGALFTHMDHSTDPRLERIQAEIRNDRRRAELGL